MRLAGTYTEIEALATVSRTIRLQDTMIRFPRCAFILVALAAVSALGAQAQNVGAAIDGIERHYNSLSAAQMEFEQTTESRGRQTMSEAGMLYLQRPGKMRWDYTRPEGKLAISDGQIFRIYSPNSHQVRQVELEAMSDLRAPLSFLLGRMRLRRMFRNLRIENIDGQRVLVGEGRSGQDFYSRVEFPFNPEDFSISGVRIFGRDDSVHVYRFSEEQTNPTLAEGMFDFKAPPGAEVVPLNRSFSDLPLDSSEQ